MPNFDNQRCKPDLTPIFFSFDQEDEDRAKAICRECPAREECRNFAVQSGEAGVWGGTTEEERRRLRRNRRTA